MTGNKITNVGTPTANSTDAATTAYVDSGLGAKQAIITGAATTITTTDLTLSRALVSNASGKVAVSTVTSTEVGYLSGVTSAIQTQLAGKSDTNHTQAATTVSYSVGTVGGVAFPTSPNGTPNDVQKAIENLFTYANSGKTQIANAIGGSAQASDSFSTLAGYISTLANKTYGVTKQVTLDESITKDDVIESYYKSLLPQKLPNFTLPTGVLSSAGAIALSDNGYIALGINAAPWHALYFQSGDTITKLNDISSGLPTGATNGIALSTNATYLAMAHTAGTFLKIFKRRGDEFTNTNVNISATPPSVGRDCAFTNDNQFLAVGHGYSGAPLQSLSVYQRTSAGNPIVDTFTKLSITDQPPDDVYGVSWSSDGTYLACAHFTTPFVTIYKRSGTTFTKLSVTGGNPAGNAFRVAFSPDDTYVAIAHTTTPFVTVYKRSGDTFTKLADSAFDVSPGNNCRSIAWSPNGVYLGVGIGAGNFQIVYKRINDAFTKQTDPATGTLPTGTANGFAWSYDAEYYAIAHSTTPFISIYKNNSSTYLFRKISLSSTSTIGRFDKIIGLAQESGTAGQSKNASILTGGGLL